MSELEDQQEQIDVSIEQARETVSKKDALMRLMDNADYKVVFTEGYFKEEAARLVQLRGDPEFDDIKAQQSIEKSIIGVGSTYNYLHTIIQLGRMAEKAMIAAEVERELMAEEEYAEVA